MESMENPCGKRSLICLSKYLKSGPVILGTKKLGGLRGGHIILLVRKDTKGFYVNDPFGDGLNSNYINQNGYNVFYAKDKLSSFAQIAKREKLRLIYWNKKA